MIKYIFWGFLNIIREKFNLITPEQEELYSKRLEICKTCPYMIHDCCALCGCYIEAKVRVDYKLDENEKSIEGCPKKYW